MSACPQHRWLWQPCEWRRDAFLVRCQDCGLVSYLATLRLHGPRVAFSHEPYTERQG